jgi:hypothetical protein
MLRYFIYPLAAFFPVWLFFFCNVFTMGYYTPLPRKLAITTVAILFPLTLCFLRTRISILFAILFVLMTWVPIGMLWIFDKAPYGM